MERRTFVRLTAYTALALTLPFAHSCSPGSGDPSSQPYFFSHIADIKTIIETGIAYRKMTPSEDDRNVIAKLLIGDNTTADEETVRLLLEKQVKQDFRSGNIVTVSGWILSVTEARQCALFSMLNN